MGIYNTVENLWIDLSIQRAFLGGHVPSPDDNTMIQDTENSWYEQIRIIFFYYYSINDKDVIVDVGCGKGRVFNYLLYKGLKNKMIGYEINETVANKTRKNLSRYENVDIRGKNILNDFLEVGNVFFLFNPFLEAMMITFRERILEIKDRNPVILYYNPICIELFDNESFVYEIQDLPPQSGIHMKLAIISVSDKS